ncbi:MAG TPA: energy transducer TonB [Bryobacteraceae bacterium]|nr:energy transducer TonB [Bryobacteraceae bacterium]
MPQVSPPTIPAFLWKVEGLAVSVAVSRSVLAELRAGLNRAPADAEFGGILIGSIARDGDGFRTQVDAFEPFPIEHRHGASYALSPRDQRVLERRLKVLRRKGRVPVGICRSHQRRGLYLDQRDFDLFRKDFRHPSSIFLLVRRQGEGATGAVFVWEEDDIRRHASYLEFPLIDPPADQVLTRVPESLIVLPAWPQHPQALRSGAGASTLLADAQGSRQRLPHLASLSLPPATTSKVVLTIALPLFSFYAAREIAFHRAVRSEVDRVRPVAEPARLPVPSVGRDQATAASQKSDPFPATSSVPPGQAAVARPTMTRKRTFASNSVDRSENDVETSSSNERPMPRADRAARVPVLPEPPPLQPVRPAASFPRMVASAPAIAGRAPAKVVAYFKPAPLSPIRGAFQKVFTGHAAGDGFVPASPVESPLPSPPASAVPLDEETNIEILAKVDRLGNVVNVKVVDGNRQLARLSTDALLRWRFDPARRNGAPVESAMRIRLEFRNPSQ